MFTLFFGGNDFAPRVLIEGEPVQEYLQRHYINAVVQVVHRLKDIPGVVGYDAFNEPSHGYIGWKDLTAHVSLLRADLQPTPLQSFGLGDGLDRKWASGVWGSERCPPAGTPKLNTADVRAWKDGRPCIWREHGVWTVDDDEKPRLLVPDYFSHVGGRDVEGERDT